MKRILIFYCLLIVHGAFSQDYVVYNSVVNSAIINVVDDRYDEALEKFDSIFDIYKPFPNHAFIAAQVAALSNSFALTQEYLLIGADVGLGLSAIQYPAFDQFRADEGYASFEKVFIEHCNQYNNGINKDYRDHCVLLVTRDQKANKTHKVINFIWPFSVLADRKLNREDELILQELDSLITVNNHQVPFRSVVGVRNFQMNTMPKNSEGTNELLLSTIFYHYPLSFQRWEEYFNEALVSGEITSKTYGTIRSFCGQHAKYSLDKKVKSELKYTDYKYFARWPELVDPDSVKSVNEEREKIGLYSIENEIKLKKAQNKFNGFYRKHLESLERDTSFNNCRVNYNYYSL